MRDVERKLERVRVDKANGHFVKFAEQERHELRSVFSVGFDLSAIILRPTGSYHRKGKTDATCSLSSLQITVNLKMSYSFSGFLTLNILHYINQKYVSMRQITFTQKYITKIYNKINIFI